MRWPYNSSYGDTLAIVRAYLASKKLQVSFDCPFCKGVVPWQERHYEDGLCRVLREDTNG